MLVRYSDVKVANRKVGEIDSVILDFLDKFI